MGLDRCRIKLRMNGFLHRMAGSLAEGYRDFRDRIGPAQLQVIDPQMHRTSGSELIQNLALDNKDKTRRSTPNKNERKPRNSAKLNLRSQGVITCEQKGALLLTLKTMTPQSKRGKISMQHIEKHRSRQIYRKNFKLTCIWRYFSTSQLMILRGRRCIFDPVPPVSFGP